MSDTERAQQRIQELRLAEALQGDSEHAAQARAAVTAATAAVGALQARRDELAASGHYTEAGLPTVLEPDVTAALAKLNKLHGEHLAPRQRALEDALSKVPAPTVPALSEMERDRLVRAFTATSGDERSRLLVHMTPKMAAALIAEDVTVTRLTPETLTRLAKICSTDEHAQQRKELEQQLDAVKAAGHALDGAAITAKRYLEETPT